MAARLLMLLGAALLVVLGMVTPASAASRPAAPAASEVQVFVGYADTLRANPTDFPTPWSGSPNVVFAGCTVNCSFDAGAVRLVNNTPLAVTIGSVLVQLSTCVFDMWPHNTVLQPGQQFIITQTASGAAGGCDNANGFFDTSDIGPNGAGWDTCTQSGVIPQVITTIDGVTNTFTDSGQVLNTGGVDAADCSPPPGPNNESTQWTLIGSQPCAGSLLSLAPPTQSLNVGALATVTANFTNSCGTPLSGVSVDFNVLSGPKAGTTGTATTDSSGNAPFKYSSSTPGTDTDQASVTNPAGAAVNLGQAGHGKFGGGYPRRGS